MKRELTNDEFHLLENILTDFYKKETTLENCKQLVTFSLLNDNVDEILKNIIHSLMLEEEVRMWRAVNLGFNEEEYIEFLGKSIYQAQITLLKTRDPNITKGLDNYLYAAYNICSIMHYLIVNFFNQFSLTKMLFIASSNQLKRYVNSNDIDFADILNSLQEIFKRNKVTIGNVTEDLSEFRDINDSDLICCLTKTTVAVSSLLLPFYNPYFSDEILIMALKKKISEIRLFITEKMNNYFSFADDVLNRIIIDNSLEDINFLKRLNSLPDDPFIEFINVFDLNKFSFVDFDYDFNHDGFGFKQVNKLFENFKIDLTKEHDEYLTFLDETKHTMAEAFKKNIPNLSQNLIKQFAENIFDEDAQGLAGTAYLFGICVNKNFKKAYDCFLNGYKLGSSECAYKLSVMYINQLYVSFDLKKRLFYLNRACGLKNKTAIKQRNEIKNFYFSLFSNDICHPKFVDIEGILIRYYRPKIKEKYIKLSGIFLNEYVCYDDDYVRNINFLFDWCNEFSFQSKLYSLLCKLEKEGTINPEIAYDIGKTLEKIITWDDYEKNSGSFCNINKKTIPKGPSICWYILAYELGKKHIEMEFLLWYGLGAVNKNRYSDDLFCKIILNTNSLKLFREYNPNRSLITKLAENGFNKAYGYLIRFYVEENNYEMANQCGLKFLSVATDEDIGFLLHDIINLNNNMMFKTNIEEYLYKKSPKLENTSSKEGCFIASCVYGSYNCPQVWVLRRYRDYKLYKTFYGRIFIKIYYLISPKLVKLFGDKKCFKKICKNELDNLIKKLKKQGFLDTPYNDFYRNKM